ncbi:agrin [Eurytemora carolleeae]|uniref:agrin n=1 Tax=Eurytemora carolleeae TaxID=1294199 RepID=UPI000C77FECF|nr:agrin [Eurytemora carolleeae]|eukprot:XP_023334990.1 agrin-like [Eurytemora affinis]
MNSLLLVLLFLSHGLTFKSSKSKCRVVPLVARRKIGADTILSASVQSFYLNNKDGPFSGKLKVRKVFQGGGAEKQAEERRTGVSSREDNDGVFLEGRSIIVEGLGDPDICVSTPRLGDTKLFFLDLVDPAVPRYKLHSSILRLSLKNLKVLWNLEKGEGVDSKCTAACQFGGVCLNGICTCQDKCTAKPYPICANDGKTVSFNFSRFV